MLSVFFFFFACCFRVSKFWRAKPGGTVNQSRTSLVFVLDDVECDDNHNIPSDTLIHVSCFMSQHQQSSSSSHNNSYLCTIQNQHDPTSTNCLTSADLAVYLRHGPGLCACCCDQIWKNGNAIILHSNNTTVRF